LLRQLDPDIEAEEVEQRVATFTWHSKAFGDYRPAGGIDVPTLMISATVSQGDGKWEPWITGPLWTEQVDADHYSLLREPVVDTVGALIERAARRELS
jgi:thioesterase domain-containing protein